MATEPQIIGESVAATEGASTETPAGRSSRDPSPPRVPAPEFGGRDGPEPTRFGDWEKNGRCIDF
jgi:hypothetical protein